MFNYGNISLRILICSTLKPLPNKCMQYHVCDVVGVSDRKNSFLALLNNFTFVGYALLLLTRRIMTFNDNRWSYDTAPARQWQAVI